MAKKHYSLPDKVIGSRDSSSGDSPGDWKVSNIQKGLSGKRVCFGTVGGVQKIRAQILR